MQICPICASPNIYFSKKRNCYLCEDCEQQFEQPAAAGGTRVFFSYGHDENQPLVGKIKDWLTGKGYDVWIDSSQIPQGRDWRERITDGLIASNRVVAFLSRHSVRDPGVCLDELRIALRLKHAYVKSVLLENVELVRPPYRLSDGQWVDMSDWRDVPEERWDGYFRQKMAELTEALESDEAGELEAQIAFLGKRLAVYDSAAKEQLLLREEFIGRDWLAGQVRDWLESGSQNRMMLFGVPGSGKSAFAANFSRFNCDVIAELYFSWDSGLYTDSDRVTRLLAYKLALGLQDYRRILVNLLKKDDSDRDHSLEQLHGSALFDWLILNPLSCCICGDRGRCLVILDGIDEIPPEIAQLLFRKAAGFPAWIRVLFTARYDEAAQALYASAHTILLDQNEARNTADLLEYVSRRLGLPPTSKTLQAMLPRMDGSFLYAKTLCGAIEAGQIRPDDVSSLPVGLNDFYQDFMDRLFPGAEDYPRVRPLFELLCVEEELTESVLCLCLGLDKYALWEMRTPLKSLITCVKRKDGEKVFRFVHKTVSDWIRNRDSAGRYYVDVRNGYGRLAAVCENPLADRAVIEKTTFAVQRDDTMLQTYRDLRSLYPYWLARSGQFSKYRKLLLASFSESKKQRIQSENDRTCYYSFEALWKWADLFPEGDELADLRRLLKEIVTFPKSLMCSELAHRSFQISALLLKELIRTGRYSDVFFEFVNQINFSAYFESYASDLDGETRDGWDKFYLTRDVIICLKKLELLKVPVPESVRSRCERMKLTYGMYKGRIEDGMFAHRDAESTWAYGILYEKELYKDVCRYVPENDRMQALKTDYNTTSLRYYFIYGEDEDAAFVRQCIEEQADATLAFVYAQERLSGDFVLPGRSDADKAARFDYVRETMKRIFHPET